MPIGYAQTGAGKSIDPGDGVVPILKELGTLRLAVIGTGFYITRYGLTVTAKHVVEGLVKNDGLSLSKGFVLHQGAKNDFHLRPILRAHLLKTADVAVLEPDTFASRVPDNPLMNLRGTLAPVLPPIGATLITYAYPNNKVLDFQNKLDMPTIHGDYFTGTLVRFVQKSELPEIDFSYIETSIELAHGASGGPVLYEGKIVGVNCGGWRNQAKSIIVPIGHLLDLELVPATIPPHSWEASRIPPERRGCFISIRDLISYGHIDVDSSLCFGNDPSGNWPGATMLS